MFDAIRSLGSDAVNDRALRVRLIAFIVLVMITLYVGFLAFSAETSVNIVRLYGWFFMMAGVSLTLVETYLAVHSRLESLLPWLRKHYRWPFWITLLALTLFLWFTQEIGFKVLMDEINLLGTSMFMHTDNLAWSALRGYEINGVFLPLEGFIDKRPLLFPFLVSLIHDVTGYRSENSFYFNLGLIPITLAATYTIATLLTNIRGGLLAMLLLACFPMFNQCAHGGGFEVLNVLMILATLLAAMVYLRQPAADTLTLLCLSAVLLANVRYESALFIFPVAVIILIGWLRSGKIILSRGTFYAPVLLLPIPLLKRLSEVYQDDYWQLVSKSADSPFGLEFVPRNVGQAVAMFFQLNHDQPVSVYLSYFVVIGGVLFLLALMRELRKPESLRGDLIALAWMSVGVLGLFSLLLLYFWDFDDVSTRRLALPIPIMMIFPAVVAVYALFKSNRAMPVFISLTIFMLFFEVAPRAAKETFTHEYNPGNVFAWKREFVKDNVNDYYLMIDVPGFWVTHQTPAIAHEKAVAKKSLLKFHLDNHTFDHIYVFESFTKDLARDVLRANPNHQLGKGFKLETVAEKTFNDVVVARISRITDINAETLDNPFEGSGEPIDLELLTRDELLRYQRVQQQRLASLLP